MSELCVVIPARNEEVVIGRCIESVLAAGVDPVDIIVIDDGSSDRTGQIASSFGVVLITNPTNIGKAESIHKAIIESKIEERYKYMALLDADTHISNNYIWSSVKMFKEHGSSGSKEKLVLICGQSRSTPCNWLTAYRAMVYFIAHYIYKPAQSVFRTILVAPGCASIYSTQIINKVDWVSDTLIEDMDVTLQIHRRKLGLIRYHGQAITYTQDPNTIRNYIGQIKRWYTGNWQVIKKHRIPFGKQRIDAEFTMLAVENVIFSFIMVLAPIILALLPSYRKWFIYVIILDFLYSLVVVCFLTWVEKRFDVLKYFILFPFLKYLDCVIWVKTFFDVYVLKRDTKEWFRVKRYDNAKKEAAA